MARMMKCCVTGETGIDFIKIGNKYYKDEETYEKHISDMNIRKNIMESFIDILGYEGYIPGQLGGLIGKHLKDCNMDYKTFYDILNIKTEYIKDLYGEPNHYEDKSRILGIFKIVSTIPQTITYGGCYQIENINTNEIYIGESIDLFQRISQHIGELYKGTHHCKSLQEAFNKTNDISHFKFTPLFLYEIKNMDRNEEKHKTLYLESAYYLKFYYANKHLYNTVNPYIALKENSVHLDNYDIDCNRVLNMLLEDKESILTEKIKQKISKDLSKSS